MSTTGKLNSKLEHATLETKGDKPIRADPLKDELVSDPQKADTERKESILQLPDDNASGSMCARPRKGVEASEDAKSITKTGMLKHGKFFKVGNGLRLTLSKTGAETLNQETLTDIGDESGRAKLRKVNGISRLERLNAVMLGSSLEKPRESIEAPKSAQPGVGSIMPN